MNQRSFHLACIAIALVFTALFSVIVIPALLQDKDLLGAFAAGFVNPYATGYSIDVLLCWATLAVWVIFDIKAHAVRHGWICLVLGFVPGVAVGFPLYLVLRSRQLGQVAD